MSPASVRMKLIIVLTALVAVISLTVFIYFPARLRDEALQAVGAKAESIAEMTAYSVAPALVFDDRRAADESFEGARRNRDLAYVIVVDTNDKVFAAYLDRSADLRSAVGRPLAGRPFSAKQSPDQRSGDRGPEVRTPDSLYETSRPILHNNRVIGRLYMGLSLAEVNAQIAQSRTAVALVSLLLFLFGVAAVTIISAYITQPLSRMVNVVDEIAAGNLERRADAGANDEIGRLARSFNAMVDQLESLQHGLEKRVDERTRALTQEIEERLAAEHALRTSERRYRLLFERNLAGVYRTTTAGTILDCNDACARIFGFATRDEFLRSRAQELFFDPIVRDEIVERLRIERNIPNLELHLRKRDGSSVWVLESMSLLEGDGAEDDVIEGTVIDITARKEAERQVEHQAYHDALTGLPNRALFTDRVNIAVARTKRKQNMAAVLFIDLDRFKYVNDTFGHNAGDVLLQHVAQRLGAAVRAEDTVARLGGDEFTILLSDLGGASDAAKVAQKLVDVMGAPFSILGHEFYITPSIGIALFPTDGHDVDTLLRNADNAMYRAKEAGPNNYRLYSEAVNKRATMRISLETSLRRAIEREELDVFYQPQVNCDTSELVGLEALVRWNHPTRGLLEPEHFIGLAEETKLIAQIDEWVLREACREAKSWETAGFILPRLSVNVSATQLHNRNLPRVIERALDDTRFESSRLEIEITESAAVRTDHEMLAMLEGLRKSGLRISIDDFGMGHSALHYLHRFPVDTIKIDKSFVHAVDANPRSSAIISAIVAMARAMDLGVIAEGVETIEQLAVVRQLGCLEVQGHLFSRALPGEEIVDFAQRPPPRTPPRLQQSA